MRMKALIGFLLFSFLVTASSNVTSAEDNKGFIPYTNGWFYIPGIDRSLEECLVIELEYGEVLIQLFPEQAPLHVARIKELATSGSYDDVVFHRVIDGFMAQTGDVKFGKSSEFNPNLVGTGNSELADLASEFNEIPHLRGICSMARSSSPNSANSQFFICLANSTFLDQQYTVWGQVISGMDFVDLIQKGVSSNNGAVSDPDIMKKVYIRELTQDQISGWLFTNKDVYPYFYDPRSKEWLYYDNMGESPRFYDFEQNRWLSL